MPPPGAVLRLFSSSATSDCNTVQIINSFILNKMFLWTGILIIWPLINRDDVPSFAKVLLVTGYDCAVQLTKLPAVVVGP